MRFAFDVGMNTTTRISSLLALLILSPACSSEPAPDVGGDAATGVDSAADTLAKVDTTPPTPMPVVECNDLTTSGDFVVPTEAFGPHPPSTGGAIVDGTYKLTEIRTYEGHLAEQPSLRSVIRFTGDKMEFADELIGRLNEGTVRFVTSDDQLTVSEVICGSSTKGTSIFYTATPTEISRRIVATTGSTSMKAMTFVYKKQ